MATVDMDIYVNNTKLPHVATYTVGWYDVSKDSGRNTTTANGKMVLNVISQKRRLDIQTTYMTKDELSSFFDKIKTSPTMSVTFYDPYTAASKTCTMYRGDRSVKLKWNLSDGTNLFEPVSIALIEL